jgi:hypothetical protein
LPRLFPLTKDYCMACKQFLRKSKVIFPPPPTARRALPFKEKVIGLT